MEPCYLYALYIHQNSNELAGYAINSVALLGVIRRQRGFTETTCGCGYSGTTSDTRQSLARRSRKTIYYRHSCIVGDGEPESFVDQPSLHHLYAWHLG